MFQKILSYFTGKGKTLTLHLKYPEEKRLSFENLGSNSIKISDEPTKSYLLEKSWVSLTNEVPKISDGAIVGASWAAFKGKNILTGALVGDYFDKHQDKSAKPCHFLFKEVTTKEERLNIAKLTGEQLERVKAFFGRR